LVAIADATENQWVFETFGHSGHNFWIGLYQDHDDPAYAEPDGGWKWITGESVVYTNWISGEPNNNGNEDWVHMKYNASVWPGQWNDVGATSMLRGVIELQPVDDLLLLDVGGQINEVMIDGDNRKIRVAPGEAISGTVNILLFNAQPESAVFPVGATKTWDDAIANVWQIDNAAPTGWISYQVPIALTAPLESGTYHIMFAAAPRFDVGQVLSATSAGCNSVWGDGNDIGWDWSERQFAECAGRGNTTEFTYNCSDAYVVKTRAATWIKVVVPSPCDADINCDGVVSVTDLLALLSAWGACP